MLLRVNTVRGYVQVYRRPVKRSQKGKERKERKKKYRKNFRYGSNEKENYLYKKD